MARQGNDAEFIEALSALVTAESPSDDLEAVAQSVEIAAQIGRGFLGVDPERVQVDGRTHLRWRFGTTTRMLLVGHLDTVWPRQTIRRWPFAMRDEIATGPGVFDMKAGVIVALMCARALADRDGLEIFLNTDEEMGSPTSGPLISEIARRTEYALVFEPSREGALKIARKGVSRYRVTAKGRAAHPGLDPGAGANAITTLSTLILRLAEVAAAGGPDATVIPTVIHGGSAQNTIPAEAFVMLDVRAATGEGQAAVDAELRAAAQRVSTDIHVAGGPTRPPLLESDTRELFNHYVRIAAMHHHAIEGAVVGGVSDGNLCAAAGAKTLDGLGAIGGSAHAEGEYVDIPRTLERMTVTSNFMRDLLAPR